MEICGFQALAETARCSNAGWEGTTQGQTFLSGFKFRRLFNQIKGIYMIK
jgi:hypothetical protein